MKCLLAHLLIAVFLAVIVLGSRRPNPSAPFRALKRNTAGEGGDIVFPGANVQQCPQNIGSCVPIAQCARAFNGGSRNNFSSICKWEDSSPFVCCPKETRARVKAKPVEFPEADCVQLGGRGGIGGQDVTEIEFYPFMVAIYQTNGNNEMFLCGGTLLSRTAILTAAHCFLGQEASSRYRVKLGSVFIETFGNTSRANQFEVISVKIHPEFKYPELYNDIAVVKIKGIPRYTEKIRPICLSDKTIENETRSAAILVGWGATTEGGNPSTILQEVFMEVISNSNCSSTFSKLGVLSVSYPKGINEKVLCVGDTEGRRRDACQGDSGGPAVDVFDGKWIQRGVVSSGVGCGVIGVPGLYTRVSEYEMWIRENA